MTDTTPAAGNAPVFQLQRVYLKDASLEMPNAPQIFLEAEAPAVLISRMGRRPYLSESFPQMGEKTNCIAEKDAIEATLREVGGSKEKAAETLGLSSTTLWRTMKRLNVSA